MTELTGKDAVLIAVVAVSVGLVYQAFSSTPVVDSDFTVVGSVVTIALLLLLAGGAKQLLSQ